MTSARAVERPFYQNEFQIGASPDEVAVSGRRSHLRMRVEAPWTGVMRVARDVSLNEADDGSLTVFSTMPGIADEELMLEMVSGEGTAHLKVKVVDSRAVVVDGVLRHRVRLRILGAADNGST